MTSVLGVTTRPSRTEESRINQDAVAVALVKVCDSYEEKAYLIVCLADGMGSLDCPEQASSLAVRTALSTAMVETGELKIRLPRMIVQANNAILAAANERDLGTTLTCVICQDNYMYLGHVGDARLFHVRDGTARCISVDHTKLAENLGVTAPSLEAVKGSPLSRKLSKSLGEKILKESDVYVLPESSCELKSGDHLILCSDGVWTEVTEGEFTDIVNTLSPPKAAERLVSLALDRDPTDDASAIVIAFQEGCILE